MAVLFFLLDALVFVAIMSIVVSLVTAAGVLLAELLGHRYKFMRTSLIILSFISSLMFGGVLAYMIVVASIPSGRWSTLLVLALLSPILAPFMWAALQFTRQHLNSATSITVVEYPTHQERL